MYIRDAKDKTVGSILKEYYEIPRFQRPYSWGREEIGLFYEDILRDGPNYFIGHIVTYNKGDDVKGVIDGQQRLTTITLILCAIRNKFIELEEKELVEGMQKYIQATDKNGQLKNVLTSESSAPFIKQAFQDLHQESSRTFTIDPKTEEENNLNAAFKQIVDKINSEFNEYKRCDSKKRFLIKLRDQILETILIYVELDSEDDAYTIFQTLNSTGKDLDLVDLIKSHIFTLIKAQSVTYDSCKDQWQKMVTELNKSRISPDTFFQHFWVSKNGLITKSKIFKEFRKGIRTRALAKKMLENIVNDFEIYLFIEKPFDFDVIKDQDIKDSLGALKKFKVKLAHSFILAMLRGYKEKKISLKNIRKCLKCIEKFHFLYTAITSSRASGISNKYAALAKNLSKEETTNKDEIIRSLSFKEKNPTLEEFNKKFRDIVFFDKDKSAKHLVHYILTQIDKKCKSSDGRTIDYKAMTVEHIVSQKHTTYGSLIGMIGNLILVDEDTQSELKTKKLQDKISILHKRGFDKDRFHLSSDVDGKDWIEERTRKLSELIYNEFSA